MLLARTWITRRYSEGLIKSLLFGKADTQSSSEEESSSELTNLTANKVDLVIGEALSKRDLSYLEPLDDLKKKFDVLKDVEKKFNLRIPSSRLNTLVNGESIKDFLLFHQQKTTRAAKLFTIDVSSLPPNLSIKQPTLRVGPKKHVVKDPSDPDNYQHYS